MSICRLKDHQKIYLRSMGKALRVTAFATSDDEANEYCAKHRDEGVIAVFGEAVFMANLYDSGQPPGDLIDPPAGQVFFGVTVSPARAEYLADCLGRELCPGCGREVDECDPDPCGHRTGLAVPDMR